MKLTNFLAILVLVTGLASLSYAGWTSFTMDDLGIDGEAGRINDIAVDSSTAAWGGTEGAGVVRFDPDEQLWFNYRELFGQLSNDNVKVVCICVDALGAIWLGTEEGITVFQSDIEYTVFTKDSGLPDNVVTALAADRSNNKWAGTQAGAARYDGSTWTAYTTADGLVDNEVFAIAVDSNNVIWFGTGNGVSTYDNGAWTSYTTANGLADNRIYDILIAPDNTVWIATENGVSVFYQQTSTWHTINNPDSFGENMFLDVKRDQWGNFWLATFDGGVKKFHDTTWVTTYTTSDGLQDNTVHAVAVGPDGTRWFGTEYGIDRFANDLPSFASSAASYTLDEDVAWQQQLSASDTNRDKLYYSLQIAPQGLGIAGDSGIVRWTPDNNDVGDTTAVVIVTDLNGGFDTLTLSLTVANVNDVPRLTASEPEQDTVTTRTGLVATFSAEGTDDDGDQIRVRWYINGILDTTTTSSSLDWVASTVGTCTVIAALYDGSANGDSAAWIVNVQPPVGIVRSVPSVLAIAPASPNPFRAMTQIRYEVPGGEQFQTVALRVYRMDGSLVKELMRGDRPPGYYQALWDGTDQRGNSVGAGQYVFRLVAGNHVTNRLVVCSN